MNWNDYHARLWEVFSQRHLAGLEQVFTNDKRPCTTNWQNTPISQMDARLEFERALARVGTTPRGRGARNGVYGPVGVGVHLGFNNLVCVDLDTRNFKDAVTVDMDFFRGLIDGGWERWLGKAYVEHTPTGGLHLFFRRPLGWEPSPKGIATLKEVGVDILFGPHQVVTAPTVRHDGEYSPELGDGCYDLCDFKKLDYLPEEFISKIPNISSVKVFKPFPTMSQDEQANLVKTVLDMAPFTIVDNEPSWVLIAFSLGSWEHPDALALFDEWSKKSPKYDAGAIADLWTRVTSDESKERENARTIYHLFHDAVVGEWGDGYFKKNHLRSLFPRRTPDGVKYGEWDADNPSAQAARVVAHEIGSGRYWLRSGKSELRLLDVSQGGGFKTMTSEEYSFINVLNKIANNAGLSGVSGKTAAKAALEDEIDQWWKAYAPDAARYNDLPKDSWLDYEAGCAFVERNKLGSMPIDGDKHVWVQTKTGLLNCTLRRIYPHNPFFISGTQLNVDFRPTAPDADDFILSWIRLWAASEEQAKQYLEVKREILASAFIGHAVKACEFFFGHTNIGKTGFYSVMMRTLFGHQSYQVLTREEFLGEKWPSDILGRRMIIVDEALGARHTDELIVAAIKNKVTNESFVSLNLKYAGHSRCAFTPKWVFTFNRYSKFFIDPAIEQRAILVEAIDKTTEEIASSEPTEETTPDVGILVNKFFSQIEKDPDVAPMILNSILKARVFEPARDRVELVVDTLYDFRNKTKVVRSELIAGEHPLGKFLSEWFEQGTDNDFVSTKELYDIYLKYLKIRETGITRSHLSELERNGKSEKVFSMNFSTMMRTVPNIIAEKVIIPRDGSKVRGWRKLKVKKDVRFLLISSTQDVMDETEYLT